MAIEVSRNQAWHALRLPFLITAVVILLAGAGYRLLWWVCQLLWWGWGRNGMLADLTTLAVIIVVAQLLWSLIDFRLKAAFRTLPEYARKEWEEEWLVLFLSYAFLGWTVLPVLGLIAAGPAGLWVTQDKNSGWPDTVLGWVLTYQDPVIFLLALFSALFTFRYLPFRMRLLDEQRRERP